MCIYAVHDAPIIFFQKEESEHYIYMSRPRSESGPIRNWSSPDPNSDLGWPKSQF